MDWFIERLRQASPTLDYQDLHNHGGDFKKLLDLNIIKYSQQLEVIHCDLCDDDHLIQPFRNAKGELVASCSGSRRIVDQDEMKIWTINRDVLIKNVNSKKPIIKKSVFEQTVFASSEASKFRIRKKDGEFHYKGNALNLSKNNDWYKVFSALYDLIPDGGDIAYGKLGTQIKSVISKTKKYNAKMMRKFIQTNLTDNSNGFMHYANVPAYEDNSKPLLSVNRGKGITFNNSIS